jgi:hypothetical protein
MFIHDIPQAPKPSYFEVVLTWDKTQLQDIRKADRRSLESLPSSPQLKCYILRLFLEHGKLCGCGR